MRKLGLCLVVVISLVSGLIGCENETKAEQKVLKIGINGEVNSIWKSVQSRLADQGVTLEFVTFSDYNLPNTALADGEIDLNCFQTVSFFEQFIAAHDLKLESLKSVYFAPMAIYSTAVSDIDEVADGAKVSIPNDSSNGGRALLLLQEAGLIELDEATLDSPTLKDIVSNPKNLEFIELVAQQIPRSFDDVTLAVMNNNVAIQSGISVIDESIFIESRETEGIEHFFNMIAVQEGHKNDPLLQIFLEVYETEETKEAMYNEFNGGWIPLF